MNNITNTIIILPCFNVEQSIRKIIKELAVFNIPVIFIDDGSTDKTYEILKESSFIVLHNEINKGTSDAILKGLKYALENGYNYAITLDSDGQHEPKYIPEFITELKKADLVIGNRFHNNTVAPDCKWNSNLFAGKLFFDVFNKSFSDIACGFKGFKIDKDLISFLNDNIKYRYDIVYLIMCYYLTQPNAIVSEIKINSLYTYSDFLFTRITEIESLIQSIINYSKKNRDQLNLILEALNRKTDLYYSFEDINILGFYIQNYNGYIIQIPPVDYNKLKNRLLNNRKNICQ